jgi:hypothetical protein
MLLLELNSLSLMLSIFAQICDASTVYFPIILEFGFKVRNEFAEDLL